MIGVNTCPVLAVCRMQCSSRLSVFKGSRNATCTLYQSAEKADWHAMYKAVNSVYDDYLPGLDLSRFWAHAELALRVFCGHEHEWVEHNGELVQCTHGDWVPRIVRG